MLRLRRSAIGVVREVRERWWWNWNSGSACPASASYNIPVACNRATADFLVSSPLMKEEYRRLTMGVEDQLIRWVQPAPVEKTAIEPLPTELSFGEQSRA
jgi:hypothetical protein